MGFAPDFENWHRLIGLNRASEHFYCFLDARFAKVQLLDLSEDLFQFLRGFIEGCAIGFLIVYVVFHICPTHVFSGTRRWSVIAQSLYRNTTVRLRFSAPTQHRTEVHS
jgi:hypothetical protein